MQRRGNIFFYNKEFKFNWDFIAAKLLCIREYNHNLTRLVELKNYKYIIRDVTAFFPLQADRVEMCGGESQSQSWQFAPENCEILPCCFWKRLLRGLKGIVI